MQFRGREIHFSALANEILRELKTAFFTARGNSEQTDHGGFCEGIMVMHLLAINNMEGIKEFRRMTREQRATAVLDFALENEEEIEALKPEIISRMEAAIAAMVESETPGKQPAQPLESLP
jgi:hypothetical protein